VNYQAARDSLRTFDLLLFSGEGIISSVIKTATNSEWSHVAVVLNLEEFDQVLIYESTTLTNVPDLVTGRRVKGVQLVQLSSRLEDYKGDVVIRFLHGERTRRQGELAAHFMREFHGRPYETNQLEMIRAALDTGMSQRNQPDASSVFCSEMVALLYRRIGVLGGNWPANEFVPGDFADGKQVDLALAESFYLDPVEPLKL
jgi:hypothetical protein